MHSECNIIEEIRDCLQCRWQIREIGKQKLVHRYDVAREYFLLAVVERRGK